MPSHLGIMTGEAMKRRDLLCGSVVIALWAAPVLAQHESMPVIGFLNGQSPGPWEPHLVAFRTGLGDAGFIEGQNIAVDYRWAEGHYEKLPALAAELAGRKVDVIVATGGTRQGPAAKEATSKIPIVFRTGSDPVAEGLVANLARPGGNVTGFTNLTGDLMEKRLELLAEMVPHAKIIALQIGRANVRTPLTF